MSMTMFWIIAGMAVVTYIPRMLPLLAFNANHTPPLLQAVLRNVPYAALGALIFPGVLTINEDIWFGVVGALTAIIIAYAGANLIIVVISTITVLSLYSLYF